MSVGEHVEGGALATCRRDEGERAGVCAAAGDARGGALLGDKAWWMPRWLDRVLPHFDIEGAAVERELAPAAP